MNRIDTAAPLFEWVRCLHCGSMMYATIFPVWRSADIPEKWVGYDCPVCLWSVEECLE